MGSNHSLHHWSYSFLGFILLSGFQPHRLCKGSGIRRSSAWWNCLSVHPTCARELGNKMDWHRELQNGVKESITPKQTWRVMWCEEIFVFTPFCSHCCMHRTRHLGCCEVPAQGRAEGRKFFLQARKEYLGFFSGGVSHWLWAKQNWSP